MEKWFRWAAISALMALMAVWCLAVPANAELPDDPVLISDSLLESPASKPVASQKEIRAIRSVFDVSAAQAENNLAIQQRATRVGLVGQLQERLGSSYAGMWFDNQTGEFVVPVALGPGGKAKAVSRLPEVVSEFGAASLSENTFRTELVDSSRAELESAQQVLDEKLITFYGEGIVQTEIDPSLNAIVVGVSEGIDSQRLSFLEQLLAVGEVEVQIDQRSHSSFKARPFACSEQYRLCDLPLRGGHKMWGMPTPDIYGEPSKTCTVGFRANGYDGKKYVLTAGHCASSEGQTTWTWMTNQATEIQGHGGRFPVGTTSQWHYPGKDWSKIDATGYWPDTPPWPTQVAYWGGQLDYPIVGEAKPYKGQTICHSGATTGTTCGIVNGENVSDQYAPDEKMNGMYSAYGAGLCGLGGDSGGPVFSNNIAVGLVSGGKSAGCGITLYFYDILEATAELDVNIAHWGAPEVITGAPSESAPIPPNNERAVSGQVNPHGLPTEYQFEYGVGNFAHSSAPVSAGSGQGFTAVYQTLYGLLPGTTYQYRLKASNSLNTSYGSTGSFKTGSRPTVNANLPTAEIATKQATIRASISPNNAPTTWWFEWGPTEGMGKETPLGSATGLGPVEVKHTLTGLTASTKYWYRVIVFNSDGWKPGPIGTFTTAAPGWLSRFGGAGTEPGQFKAPIALAVDQGGNAYVADQNNHRIQKFNADGEFVMQFGVKGSAPGQISSPQAVAIDLQGDIWVAEASNKRIQEFTAAGEFIREIGPNEGINRPSSMGHLAIGPNGDIYFAQEFPGTIYHYSSTPNSEGKYFLGKATGAWIPEGIVKHPSNGNMYFLSEEGPRAIFRLGTGAVPTPIKVCEVPWTTTPEIKNPEGFTIDFDGNGLISSSGTNQVVKVSLACKALAGFGAKGVGPGQFISPTALALAPSGILFVGDGQHSTAPGPGITRWAW
jgi:hypothetical protein